MVNEARRRTDGGRTDGAGGRFGNTRVKRTGKVFGSRHREKLIPKQKKGSYLVDVLSRGSEPNDHLKPQATTKDRDPAGVEARS